MSKHNVYICKSCASVVGYVRTDSDESETNFPDETSNRLEYVLVTGPCNNAFNHHFSDCGIVDALKGFTLGEAGRWLSTFCGPCCTSDREGRAK